MANTMTTMGNTIIASKALETFVAAMTPVNAFARNFSEAEANRGDKIKVLSLAAAAVAQSWVAANGYTIQDDTYTGKDISLDKRQYVSWHLTTEEAQNNPLANLERLGRQKGFALAKAVLQDIWSVITLANFGAPSFTGDGAVFDADEVATLEKICDEANWPGSERALIVAPAYHTGIVKDNAVQGDMGVQGSVVLSDSRVTRLHNFNVYKSNLIPANAENLKGMVVNPDAIMTAMRVLRPDDKQNTIDFQVMADPGGSGIALGFREWFDPDKDRTIRVLEASYGYLLGNATALKRIVSA